MNVPLELLTFFEGGISFIIVSLFFRAISFFTFAYILLYRPVRVVCVCCVYWGWVGVGRRRVAHY